MKGENCSIIRSKSLIRARVRASRRNDITKVLSAILRVDRQKQRGVQDYAKVEFKQKKSHEYKKRAHYVPLAANCFTKGVSCISEVMAALLRPL